ncbi:MAG: glucose-1-phosphate cytidylyltransferase [Anaerolineales bacterium]|jgi:glucose-1-phosphate cytidylyltransferase|nr:glucose-1-phosphate cytidylyltransferase [Chloroflexota bacterium]MBK6646977.1 glucose-1-phosphate cytidylyltransferase [Anaerolineales bacterium]
MKVVLFCGGLGTRLGKYSETVPKPMIEIGIRPLIWHLMRYYAHYGHKDFILCLGYKGSVIKKFFLEYNECISNDFVYRKGGRDIRLFKHDIEDWTISFVETGMNANIGQRLLAVRDLLEGEDAFMANYSDGLSDLDLNAYLENFRQKDKVASFLCVKPAQSFHSVSFDTDDHIKEISPIRDSGVWFNGGFFAFKREIFDYIREGEELVEQPFFRLVKNRQVIGYKNQGFWSCIDTMKDKKAIDDMFKNGNTPWMVWKDTLARQEADIIYPSGGRRRDDR